ncbi:MAG: hypothetical protein ACW98X_17885, partial [Promethearchaeota archaeon]
ILDEKTREGLIEEAVKGVSHVVGQKVDERLGSALGNIAGIFMKKFMPLIEAKIGDIDFGNFKIPHLDTPQAVQGRKISGCSEEEAEKYRRLFGWEVTTSSKGVPPEKRVTTPLKPTAPVETTPKEEPVIEGEEQPIETAQGEQILMGMLAKATKEELEGYMNVNNLEFALKPHIERYMDEAQKKFVWENLSVELVFSSLEQMRPDLMPLLKTEKGIKWATSLIEGVKHICKPVEEEKAEEE